ncbi:serine/threonine-protein phosphatase PGAM5, mitochondrial isoform X1 [Bos indicus x Bos taurus]|uniref:serine/threonine-protein phosphatase PGAM5, mitochondrial isoform X1 n=1 Tax=Bos indicus x Bos taurus TaxID=30522 RepID=UPI000F7D338D|nr:serine/threonine-protein phosphatase PGAM5, mitochondrial isoform X1 [Bos indicus x Bos taurus]
MAFRQALQLAACGLAGGSAAVLFSAVAVGKPRAGGDAEPRVVEPPAWAGTSRPGPGVWDPNWDRREPLSLVNLRKRNLETGEEELTSRLDHCKAKATRHIFLIRHSQYHVDASLEKDRTLTPLGREQAELTGLRLASLGLKFNKIVHSSMTRAVETTDIISKHLPGVCKVSTDLLREGAPIEPDPPVSHWKPEAVVKKTPPGAASCGEQPPLCPWAPGGSGAHTASIRTIPSSAPSSIMKMEHGSRPPSGTISTGRTPSSRRTAMRSSSATPMSFATSCAGRCSSLQKAGSAFPSTTAALPTWWSGPMAEWLSGPLGTQGSCLLTRSPVPEGRLEAPRPP